MGMNNEQAAPGTEMTGRHFCISIAGHVIGIDSLYEEVYSLCEEYICEMPPEIKVTVREEDLDVERKEAKRAHLPTKNSSLEIMTVYRKISDEMLCFNTLLMHGAVIACGKEAYMFSAESGTGKTTHIKKWLKNAENVIVVNGDKPLIRITDTQAIACGTPWCGKEQLSTNTMVPLKAIVLMERGEHNLMQEISFGQAFLFLLQQTYRPDDAGKMKKTLSLLSRLDGRVRFFRFIFNNMKDDAFEVAYHTLTGGRS